MRSIHMRTAGSGRSRLGRMWLGIMPDDRSKPPLNETTRVFGERVRDRRLALGLSQEAAAVRCGIHWTQLGKVERGQRSLRLETIVKIADGLDIDAGRLVSRLPVPSPE
jgi:ribosome-binding protein aMBF1 (putative translation factor)